jgi:hypothetical protein
MLENVILNQLLKNKFPVLYLEVEVEVVEQDLGIWNHLGVVVNWLLGACKMLGACKLDLGKHLGKHLGELLGACKLHL